MRQGDNREPFPSPTGKWGSAWSLNIYLAPTVKQDTVLGVQETADLNRQNSYPLGALHPIYKPGPIRQLRRVRHRDVPQELEPRQPGPDSWVDKA